MTKCCVLVLAMLVLSACSSDPMELRLGKDPLASIEKYEKDLKQLPKDDIELMKRYIVATDKTAKEKGKANPAADRTIAEVLQDARAWEVTQIAASEEKRKRDDVIRQEAQRMEAERKTLMQRITGLLYVTLVKRTVSQTSPAESFIQLEYDVQNTSGKPVLAFKGKATFKDVKGNIIAELPLKNDKTVRPSEHLPVTVKYVISPGTPGLMKLATAAEGQYFLTFAPDTVILEGGQTITTLEKTGT